MGMIAILVLAACLLALCQAAGTPPNIVLVVADDLGWNDIGFNNPEIKSPILDRLAREGIILNQSYVQSLGSPSRAALMTGEYPFRMGLQHLSIKRTQPVCVPLTKTLLPEVLKKQGYATHMVGKWHLGFCDWRCTPTERGFDSFYGFYGPEEDYFDKTHENGFDFRDNKTVAKSANGTYSTYLYTERIRRIIRTHDVSRPLFLYLPYQNVQSPLQVPKNYTELYPGIKDEKRAVFSGMVSALDEAVGNVIESLKGRGLYENTLFVFLSDNGGKVDDAGNNWPLRGGKFTLFEGGTRSVSFVHGRMFNKTGVRYDGLMHVVDWYPTLADAAGVQYDAKGQDGVSQWQSLVSLTTPSKRQEILYNLDLSVDPAQGRAAIRVGDYKLVAGFPGLYPDWYPLPGADVGARKLADRNQAKLSADAWNKILESREQLDMDAPIFQFLFNLKDDPEERNNIYDSHPDVVKDLQSRLDAYRADYAPPNFPPSAEAGNPAHYGGVWTPGWCPDVQ